MSKKTAFGFGFAAREWQGHKKPLLPVSVEVSEEKVQVWDRSGAVLRCFHLGGQDRLDVLLSDNRHRRAALLKGSKERDLVRNGRIEHVLQCGPNLLPMLSVLHLQGAFF